MIIISDGSIKIEILVDNKPVEVTSKALDSLEAAAQRSGKGAKSVADGMSSLSSSSSKASKDVASTSGAVDNLASTSTSASKNVAGAASNLGDLSNISSSASKNLQGATSAIGDIAGGSTAASSGIKSTASNFTDLSSISSTAGSNLQNTNLVLGDLAGGSTTASGSVRGASDSLNNMGGSADNAADAARRAAQETENVGNASGRASMGIKEIAVSLGLVALASAAISTLKASLDGAISRFDTLEGFPVVMERMGFSSEQAEKSINKLSDGIQGLPTTLDGIVASTQRIAILTGDLEMATDTALALNNAFLASGSNAMNAERGLTQYVQMLSKGSVDIMSWRTLQETMGYALKQTAAEFGFAGESAQNDLYAALKKGDIYFKDFNAKLIELNGGVGGFADMAATGSAGVATSMKNLGNAVVVGLATTIKSFDKLSLAINDKKLYENLDGLKAVVKSSFKVIGEIIEGAAPVVIVFASAIKATIPVVQALTPAIIGLAAAYASYAIITSVTAAIKASNAVLVIAQASASALTLATRAQMTAAALSATATGANAAATVAQTGAVTLSTLAVGLLTGKVTLSTVAQVAAAVATTAWGVAIKFLMGPVGWVVAGIGLLVAGVVALVKWFNKSTEEGERLAGQTDTLAESTKSLNTAVGESSIAYEKTQANLEGNAQLYTEMIAKVEELAAKENKSGEEKKELNSYIEELNKNVSGLNLVYGEESNALSMTSEQMTNRINLMKEEQGLQASQERLTEIIKEQIDVQRQLEEINTLRAEWEQKLDDGTVKSKEHKDALEDLEKQEVSLSEVNKLAGDERLAVEQQIIESSKAVADAMENDISRQMLMYDELSDSQKEAVDDMKSAWDDYASAATDMFDKLSDKSKVSVKEMQSNLEENQRVITSWSENIATLAERGIDEGLLNTLREAGPESAGHVNALVKASDDELMKLSEAFSKGGDVATKALSTSLGIKDSGILESVGHLVVGTEKALADSIKNADFAGLGVEVAKGQAEGMKKGTPEAEKAAKEMAKATEDAARNQLETHSPSKVFERIGKDSADGLTLGVNKGTKDVIKAMQSLTKSSIEQFKTLPKDFEGIGKNTMAGFNVGLKNGEAQVLATAQRIADSVIRTTRKALDINSPAGEFIDIGKYTGEGMVVGIKSTMSDNEKAMLGVVNVIIGATKNNAKEVAKISTEAEKKRTEIQSDYAKKRAELSSKTASSSQAALKTHKNKKGEIVRTGEDKVYKIRSDASAKLTKLNEDEQKKLATVNTKAWADMQKKESELSKAKLESIKTFIADKKSLEEVSVAAESEIWRQSIGLFKEGTKERVEVQKNYQAALKTINDEVLKVNEEYGGKMQKINDTLRNEEQKLTDAYEKSVGDRTKALTNFMGIFDAYEYKFEQTGQDLTNNLQSQVAALESWSGAIERLSERAIDKGLLAELREMGPKALPQLIALNQMTEAELTHYSALYRTKSALARTQAEKEMAPMKANTEKQIIEMRNAANRELENLRKDWTDKIQRVTKATNDEMMTLKSIGVNAGQGLLDGLSSMESSLIKKAKTIAESVKSAMANALDINSPSRWMRDFIAGNMALGFIKGVDKNESKIMSAASHFGDLMKPNLNDVMIPNVNIRPFNPSFGSNGSAGSGSAGNSTADQLGDLISAIKDLASRPASFEIDGKEVVKATAKDMSKELDVMQNRNRRVVLG